MQRLRMFVIAAALALPTMAAAQDVKTDWDKSYDFSKPKTFAMKLGTSWGNQLSENRVLKDLTEALTEKGWKAAPEASADTIVVVHGATDTKKTLNTFYDGYGYGGWGYSGFGGSTTTVSEYLVGTLVVDIFEKGTKKLIFRGTASDEISKDPSKNEKKSDKAAQKMFKNFPPKPKEQKS